jgi:hypothetical protein
MSYALEVVRFRDALKVSEAVRYVPNQVVTTLEIRGDDFRTASAVRVNDVVAPTFQVVNKNIMWIPLTADMGTALRTVEVDSHDFTRTVNASRVIFEIGEQTRKISGILKLLQLYTKWILQTPGSDIFNPARGGGLQSLLNRVVSIEKMNHVMSLVTRAVDKTTRQIKTAQSGANILPLDERLLDASIQEVKRSYEKLGVQVSVMIVSVAGEDAISSIML